MEKTLENFVPKHSFLVCIDSDGCAFDVMEVKHKECFCPATVNDWDLQAVSRYAREAWEFVNLYSVYRGINRFLALDKVLDLTGSREEVKRLTGFSMPDGSVLKKWIQSGEPLNNQSLEKYKADSEYRKILNWSLDCNQRISDMVRGVPPFPYVRESLEKLAEYADIVIVSATATEALMREWSEHGLLPLVSAICGQEVGSKAQCIEKVKQSYEASHCLMIGDAPGDGQAAKKNGILFYPICPLKETESWKQFYVQTLDWFLNGQYAGEHERQVIDQFEKILPKTPTWRTQI